MYITNLAVYDRGWASQKKWNLSAGCGFKVQMHSKYVRKLEMSPKTLEFVCVKGVGGRSDSCLPKYQTDERRDMGWG